MRIKSWTDLCVKSQTFSIFDGAERAKGYFDPLLVVPSDVGINVFDELIDCDGIPIAGVK